MIYIFPDIDAIADDMIWNLGICLRKSLGYLEATRWSNASKKDARWILKMIKLLNILTSSLI